MKKLMMIVLIGVFSVSGLAFAFDPSEIKFPTLEEVQKKMLIINPEEAAKYITKNEDGTFNILIQMKQSGAGALGLICPSYEACEGVYLGYASAYNTHLMETAIYKWAVDTLRVSEVKSWGYVVTMLSRFPEIKQYDKALVYLISEWEESRFQSNNRVDKYTGEIEN